MSFADDMGITDYNITGEPNMLNPIIHQLGLYKKSPIDREVWERKEAYIRFANRSFEKGGEK